MTINNQDVQKIARLARLEVSEEQATKFRRRITHEDTDFVPCVVGEATRVQSLVNDLLAHCRISVNS